MADEKEQEKQEHTQPEPATPAAPADKAAEGEAPQALETEKKETARAPRKARGRSERQVPVGVVHIRATFNNTMVTITDPKGAVIAWSSAGRCGFKGSRKSTAYAATMVAQEAARQAVGYGMHEVEVEVQGPGSGRESAIRAVQSAGLNVTSIRDVTPIPHNGCRPPKRRRV